MKRIAALTPVLLLGALVCGGCGSSVRCIQRSPTLPTVSSAYISDEITIEQTPLPPEVESLSQADQDAYSSARTITARQQGLTFRSALNSALSLLSFPRTADRDRADVILSISVKPVKCLYFTDVDYRSHSAGELRSVRFSEILRIVYGLTLSAPSGTPLLVIEREAHVVYPASSTDEAAAALAKSISRTFRTSSGTGGSR